MLVTEISHADEFLAGEYIKALDAVSRKHATYLSQLEGFIVDGKLDEAAGIIDSPACGEHLVAYKILKNYAQPCHRLLTVSMAICEYVAAHYPGSDGEKIKALCATMKDQIGVCDRIISRQLAEGDAMGEIALHMGNLTVGTALVSGNGSPAAKQTCVDQATSSLARDQLLRPAKTLLDKL